MDFLLMKYSPFQFFYESAYNKQKYLIMGQRGVRIFGFSHYHTRIEHSSLRTIYIYYNYVLNYEDWGGCCLVKNDPIGHLCKLLFTTHTYVLLSGDLW